MPPRGERWLDDWSGSCRRSGKHSGWQAYGGQAGQGGDVAMVFEAEEYSVFTFSIL